jgi:hypothetical protein
MFRIYSERPVRASEEELGAGRFSRRRNFNRRESRAWLSVHLQGTIPGPRAPIA